MAIISKTKEEVKETVLYRPSYEGSSILIKKPYITEKSTQLAEQGQYVFLVTKNANKIEIKKAIRDIYKVDVIRVNKIKMSPKKKGWGKNAGTRPGFVKAIVTLKKGQKIELLK